jgi:ketosteroid isomerase-like protein
MPTLRLLLLALLVTPPVVVCAQQTPPPPGVVPGMVDTGGFHIISPVVQPTLSPGQLQLIALETQFAEETAKGGGKAFASWFAEDAVTLSNGKPAVLGRGAIAAEANWDPKQYSLTWTPQGAQMGPSNDMGFTWGHYVGTYQDADGKPVVTAGRYITVWRRLPNGSWKVALDASANEPADPGSCCSLPNPASPPPPPKP